MQQPEQPSDPCSAQCPGPPPPQFLLPPPPRPPFLLPHDDGEDCNEEPLLPYELCDALPVLDAELQGSPSLPPTAVIVVGCALLAATLLVIALLLCKYRRKVPAAAPHKAAATVHLDGTAAPGVAAAVGDAGFEDVIARQRALAMPPSAGSPALQMTDLKSPGAVLSPYPNGFPVLRDPSVYPYISEDLYNPVYEEISHGSGERGETDSELPASEDEFAEDELSLAEMTAATAAGHHRMHGSPPPPLPPLRHQPSCSSAGSLEGRGRRSRRNGQVPPPPPPEVRCTVAHLPSPPPPAPPHHAAPRRPRGHRSNDSEFHEGLLLDALLQQLYQHQQVFGNRQPTPSPPPHRHDAVYYPGAEVFTTLRHHHGRNPQQQQRRRGPNLHSGSSLGLS